MKATMLAAATCVLFTAAAATAQDSDAETKFHRAYEQEVVEGKVADAAKVYLGMMGDEKVPERLRLESKFRFAVTAVLLGRADEARSHFADLVRDPKTPETLRARAAEYLDAAKGIGVGSELDRKLQALVFDLAKDGESAAAAYRAFEVIGRPAVPFLRKLLTHDDRGLRVHAFSILLRMGEPGMADVWTPQLSASAGPEIALNSYLKERPEELDVFERRLLALEDEALASALALQSYLRPQLTAPTLRALAARKVDPRYLLAWFPTNWTVETDRVRGEWIAGDDAALSAEATISYLTFVGKLPDGNIALRTDLFPAIVARLAARANSWKPTAWYRYSGDAERPAVDGLVRLACTVPLDSLIDTMTALVDRAVATPPQPGGSDPLHSGLVDALAIAADRCNPDAPLPPRYAEVLKKWFTEASRRAMDYAAPFASHVRATISRLPRDAAESLAMWTVTNPLRGLSKAQIGSAIPAGRPQDVPVALAALRAADPEARVVITGSMGLKNDSELGGTTREVASALTPALAEIVRLWVKNWADAAPPIRNFVVYAQALPVEEARARFVEVAEAVAEMPDEGRRRGVLRDYVVGITKSTGPRTAYWRDVVLPSLDVVWTRIARADHETVLTGVLSLLEKERDETLRASIGRFVSARYGEVSSSAAHWIAQAPDVFPLTEWVPRVCPDTGVTDNAARVPSERADPAVREMTKDAATVNRAVLAFTAISSSIQTEVFDRLVRTAPVERLPLLLDYARAVRVETLEDALRRTMECEKPAIEVVARLVPRIQAMRPSEKLFPGVRMLLASDMAGYVAIGITAAKSLGRDELLPALAGLLDSMDEKLRQSAKEAIDAIVELRKLKEEARRQAGAK